MTPKTLLLVLCLSIGLNHALWIKKKAIPTELRRVMANVTSLDSFLRAVSVERISRLREAVTALNKRGNGRAELLPNCPVVTQPNDCPQNGKDLCMNDSSCPHGFCCNNGCIKECVSTRELGATTKGKKPYGGGLLARLIENSPDLPYVILDSTPCAPHPVVVEVPQPVDESTFYFPFFVTLYQCGGACNARPYDTACQPAAIKDLNLVVSKVAWSSAKDELGDISNEFTTVRMTNHTSCSCQCKVKPTDCDNRTQEYSKEHCSCQCKRQKAPCPFNFRWDPVKCQCVCDPTNVAPKCKKRFQFDEKLCQCTCSKRPCKQDMKVRDPRSCFCRCPRMECPIGMTLERRSCTCVGNL